MDPAGSLSSTLRIDPSAGSRTWRFRRTGIALLVVGANVLTSFVNRGPLVHGDEAGYLTIARHLSGGPRIQMGPATLFHPGTGFIFTPASLLGWSPESDFRFIQLTLALLTGNLFLLLASLADRFTGHRSTTSFVALIAVAYPSVTFHANLA